MQKFSIGLSDIVSVAEYQRLFSVYNKQLDFFYFSVPGLQYQTRSSLYQTNSNVKYICAVLNLAKEYNLQLELALNTWDLTPKDILSAQQWLVLNNIKVDAVVILQKYLKYVRKFFPDAYLLNSCNDLVRSKQSVDSVSGEFSEIVYGTGAIKNPRLWQYTQSKGFKTRIILNSGCSFACHGCTESHYCDALAEKNISRHGCDFMYALQSIMPREFTAYYKNNNFINGFKLSTQVDSYTYVNNCLDSYINNNEYKYLNNQVDSGYFLWKKFAFTSKESLDYSKITKYKTQYWQKILRLEIEEQFICNNVNKADYQLDNPNCKLNREILQIFFGNNYSKVHISSEDFNVVVALSYLWDKYSVNCYLVNKATQVGLFGQSYGQPLNLRQFSSLLLVKDLIGEDKEIHKTAQHSVAYMPSRLDIKNAEIFRRALFASMNLEHNQALDVLYAAKEMGINLPRKLLNIDSHSDIYINKDSLQPTVGTWVNEAVRKYDLKDVYWVMSKEIAQKEVVRQRMVNPAPCREQKARPLEHSLGVRADEWPNKIFTQALIIDKATGAIFPAEYGSNPAALESKLENSNHRYEFVNVHFCTEYTIPDFDGEEVILSIDADALSLSGFDTTDHLEINRETGEIKQAFSVLLQKLADCHAAFTVIDLTFSIGYLPLSDVKIIKGIFDFIMAYTPQKTNNIL
ncbi:MAG: hypothetical protein LBE13_14765 [Bacteroidales bacterium]|jgi:hypothetical protein|nr:hypothetical protein [Bacteroidales bacterium]